MIEDATDEDENEDTEINLSKLIKFVWNNWETECVT